MNPKVIILGGGIAGLSAAHELVERGFTVEVHELLPIPGGKARSFPVPKSGTNGRKDLDCQFPAAALPLGTNYGVLEGKAVIPGNPNPQTFRARDIVTVTK